MGTRDMEKTTVVGTRKCVIGAAAAEPAYGKDQTRGVYRYVT